MRALRITALAALLLSANAAAHGAAAHGDEPSVELLPKPAPKAISLSTIEFADFYNFGPTHAEPTDKLNALNGKKVTLVGFMVEMSDPAKGGFYLAPYPALSDESAGGRAGIPPVSVLVVAPIAKGKKVAQISGVLEVTGILE